MSRSFITHVEKICSHDIILYFLNKSSTCTYMCVCTINIKIIFLLNELVATNKSNHSIYLNSFHNNMTIKCYL